MNEPVPGEVHEGAPKCGGTNRQGKPCGNPRGYKTDHPGTGNCRWHGGSSPNGHKHAVMEGARKAVETYGLPRDIDPIEALLEEIHWTAGHVAWLREQVQALEPDALTWGMTEEAEKNATEFSGTDVTRAASVNVWLQLYMTERKHLVDVCKTVIALGIEERRVKLAEAQGAILNGVLRRIFARLSLSAEQSALLPVVVPEELRRAAAMAAAN